MLTSQVRCQHADCHHWIWATEGLLQEAAGVAELIVHGLQGR